MASTPLSRFMNGFLTTEEAELGRLVLDTENPQKTFCKAAADKLQLTDDDRSRREFDNIVNLVGATSASNFKFILTKLLDIIASKFRKSVDALKTAKAVRYDLYNVNEKLEELLKDDKVKKWVEKYRQKNTIFMIVALYTVKDASVQLDANEAAAVDVKVKVPVTSAADAIVPGASLVAEAAGLNAEANVGHSSNREQSASFIAPGERIIAIGYQRLRFRLFSSSADSDAPRLTKATVWKSFDTSRSADKPDMVEATVEDLDDINDFVEDLKARGYHARVEAEHNGFVILEGQV